MRMISKIFLRALSLVLLTALLIPSLFSCTARPLAQSKLAGTEVGKVGEYSVAYEEFYFLAHNRYLAVKDDYANDPEGLKKNVWDYVNENITSNYAILELCETMGILYDEDKLKDDVEKYLELSIESDFNGSRKEYLSWQKTMGLTDHYVRFTTGVDMLYEDLSVKYFDSGILPNTDEELTDYIKNNFVHTVHIAVFVDPGDDRNTERAKAEQALALLDSGKATILPTAEGSSNDLIGSLYNEDLIPPTTSYDGYYFPRGIMEKWYEDTAFSLEVGEHSGIINSIGSNSAGEYVECFYIIERLPNYETDISSNFIQLSDMVTDSLIYEDMEAIKATLSFTANDFARSLDVTDLDQPKNGADTTVILIIALCVVSVGCAVTLVFTIRYAKKRRFRKTLNK